MAKCQILVSALRGIAVLAAALASASTLTFQMNHNFITS